jgi:hypothetical protein
MVPASVTRPNNTEETAMSNTSKLSRCPCCGNPFPVVEGRVQQWRVGNQFACNEFCAEGIENQQSSVRPAS